MIIKTTYKNILIALMLLMFSTLAFAEDPVLNGCGINDNGFINPISGEICAEDQSFRIFYKLFPDVFNKIVFKIIEPNDLMGVAVLEEDSIEVYRGYQYALIYGFKAMIEMGYALLGIFIFYYSLMSLLRGMESGEFMGKDWSFGGTIQKYSFLAVMLVPLGNGLVVGQILIFILIIVGIYLGNYMWGVYLSYLEVGPDPSNAMGILLTKNLNETEEQKLEAQEKLMRSLVQHGGNHLMFNADNIVEKMIDINLCKIKTEQYIVEKNLSSIKNDNISIQEFTKCAIKNPQNAQVKNLKVSGIDGVETEDAFLLYNLESSEISNIDNPNRKVYFRTKSIDFGGYTQNQSACYNTSFDANYNCGNAISSVPEIKDPKVKEALKAIDFFNKYKSFTGDFDETNLASVIYSNWEPIRSDLIDYYSDNTKNLRPDNEDKIKFISYLYHQMIYTDLIMGNISGILPSQLARSGRSVINLKVPADFIPDSGANIYSMLKINEKAQEMAEKIVEFNCISNVELLRRSQRLMNQLNDGNGISGEISATCLKMDSIGDYDLYGTDFFESENDPVQLAADLASRGQELREDLRSSYDKLAKKIMLLNSGIEGSFYKSMTSLPSGTLVQELRKKGWFSLGSYIFKISKEKEIEHKMLSAIRNSISFKSNIPNRRYISADAYDGAESSERNANYENMSYSKDKLIDKLVSDENKIFPLAERKFVANTDGASYVNDFLSDKLLDSNLTYATSDLDSIMHLFTNPFSSFKTAVGYPKDTSVRLGSLTECLNEPDVECPVPKENPLVGLSNFGNQLIEVGATAMAASVMMTKASEMLSKRIETSIGSVSDGENKNPKGAPFLPKALLGAVDFINIFFTILAAFSAILLIIGMLFSYAIPLIPFVAFTVAFVAWVVFCIQALFLFPLWCVFGLRIVANSNTNSEIYRSAYNIMIQIAFKPIIIVVAYILVWSLLSVLVGILNLTIVSYIVGSFEVRGMLLEDLISSIVLMLVYGFLLFIVVNMAFKMLHELINKIFGCLNVANPNDTSMNPEDAMKGVLTAGIMASVINKPSQDIKKK